VGAIAGSTAVSTRVLSVSPGWRDVVVSESIVAIMSTAAYTTAADQEPILLELPAVGEFTRLSLWMAGSLAGVATSTHAAQGRHFRDMARRLGWSAARRAAAPSGDAALALLAEALVGTTRWAVNSVFGQPSYAVADSSVSDVDAVWSGRAWYFPMRHPGVSAVAVHYKGDLVDRVVFIGVD
jgi:hypothetical protein